MKHLIVTLLLCAAAASASEPPALSHNPFSRPPSQPTAGFRDTAATANSSRDLELRATMVTTNSKLANVAGRTLRPGDEVQGYTLLQVFEDRAIFVRDRNRITVYVKPDPEDDDE